MNNYKKYLGFQNALMMAGQGTIMLCVAIMLRLFLYLTIDKSFLDSQFDIYDVTQEVKKMAMIVMIIVSLVDVFVRYKIGTVAMRVAREGLWKKRYTVIVVIYFILSFLGAYSSVKENINNYVVEQFSGTLLEIIADILYIVMLVSAYKVQSYRKANNML